MRRRLTYLLLSLFIVAGSGQAFADGNNHRGKARQEQGNHRPGGNSGNKHANKNNGHSHSNKKNDKFSGNNHRPGNNNQGGAFIPVNNFKPGNGNNGKPGNNHNVKPGNNHKPGNDKHHGNNPKPAPGHGWGNTSAPRPGTGHAPTPVPPGHHHGAPVPPPPPAPVMRPAGGFHFGPALPPPPPRLPYMVDYVTRGCHDVNVWQVSSDTFIVKYRRGGRWYTQYLYPYSEMYGNPTLISINWQPLSPWTFIPPIQLNINL